MNLQPRFALALLALLLAHVGCLSAAPAPLARQRREAAPFGPPCECAMLWHGSRYHAYFHGDGSYSAALSPDAVAWVGRWRREADRVLVEEHPVGHVPGQWTCSWSFRPGERAAPIYVEPWGE